MKKISIVVPCYNEEESIELFYEEILKIKEKMAKVSFELIFVNDGSKDNTLKIMTALAKKDTMIKYISFSRNFGKESAMLAGLEHATGDYITTMDVDLQDPPELLIEMYETLETTDYDCVATKRRSRKGEPKIKSLFSMFYYYLINKISKTKIVAGARDFRLMNRQMLDSILELQEYNRFSKGIFSWVGYNVKWLEYDNIKRQAGTTKWSFWNLFKYSIESMVGFSTAPLAISSLIGLLFFIISIIMIIIIICRTLMFGDNVAGWPSLVCIIFFVSGIQLLCLSIIGQYLAKTYTEVKKRPSYIIKESNIRKQKKGEKDESI